MIFLSYLFLYYILRSKETCDSNIEDKNTTCGLNHRKPTNIYYINMISYNLTWFILCGRFFIDNDLTLETILNNVIKKYPAHVEKHFVELMNLEWNDYQNLYEFNTVYQNIFYWKFLDRLVYRLKNTVLEMIIKEFEKTIDSLKERTENPSWTNSNFQEEAEERVNVVKKYLISTKSKAKKNSKNKFNTDIIDDLFFKESNNLEYLFEKQFLTKYPLINSNMLKILYGLQTPEISENSKFKSIFYIFEKHYYFTDILNDIFYQIGISSYIFNCDLTNTQKKMFLKFKLYLPSNVEVSHNECYILYLTDQLKPLIRRYVNAIFQNMNENNLINIFLYE